MKEKINQSKVIFIYNEDDKIIEVEDEHERLPKLCSRLFGLLFENINEFVSFERICQELYQCRRDRYLIRSIDVQLSKRVKPFAKRHNYQIRRLRGKGLILEKAS